MRGLSRWIVAGFSLVAAPLGTSAADLTRPDGAYPLYIPVYNWTGFYVGGNIGGAWASGTLTDNLTGGSVSDDKTGVVGGAQLGYNLQLSNFVVGAEWNFDFTSLSASGATGPLLGSANTNWITTLAARFGYAMNNWLFYGKAGAGWVNNQVTVTNTLTGTGLTVSNTNNGWLVGAGFEYGFGPVVPTVPPNWSVKVEYDYIGLSPWTNGWVSATRDVQTFTIGLNYRINAPF